MEVTNEKLFTEFPPVSTQEWMDKVNADLKGADFEKKLVWRTNEGFSVKPMYRAEDIEGFKTTSSLPGEFPYIRGTKVNNEWLVRQNISVECTKTANDKAKELLSKGVTSLGFTLSSEVVSKEGIAQLLDGICPESVELNFSACAKVSEKLISLLAAYFSERGIDTKKAKGSVNFDVIGKMMIKGKEITDYASKIAAIVEVGKVLPKYRVLAVNSVILNNGGAYIAQELGYALAWGNALLSMLAENGIAIDVVAKDIKFNMGIGSNYFMEIAKFRAARMLWAQIVAQYAPECGCSAKMVVNTETSKYNMTIYDANVNMLRSQTESMSAALAGVDSIVVNPYDITYKNSDEFSERIARNQQLLLKDESHLNKIVDPSAGSYYIENLTMAIAEQAWKLFLEVEDNGGFIANVLNGNVQKAINESDKKRCAALASRREILLGTNQFPNFSETASEKIVKTVANSCDCSSNPDFEQINTNRLAHEFEELRLATERSGRRPKAFMLTIGNLAMRLARAQFSCNFFGCAGYENIDNLGFETVDEGVNAALNASADIIVLCSSDDEYAELAPKAYELIKDKAIFVVAGAPACAEELKAAGITNFINVKSNVLETLRAYNAKLLK